MNPKKGSKNELKRIAEKNHEKEKLKDRIGNFSSENSEAFKYLRDSFGRELKGYEIYQLAEYFVSKCPSLRIDREAKRRKEVMLKWYDENFEILKPMLENIVIEDEDQRLVGPKSSQLEELLKNVDSK